MMGASAGAVISYIKHKGLVLVRETREARDNLSDNAYHTAEEPKSHLGIKALIVGHDPETISIFSRVLREKGIESERFFSESLALERLSSAKFQALVLDCDEIDFSEMLKRLPRPNERVLVIAVANENKKQVTSRAGISFVVERPLTPPQVREVVRAAYGRMLRDGQQYFRLTAELPVSIRKASGAVVQCMTLNVSQTGMAVESESSFTTGDAVNIAFAVPNTDIVLAAQGKVIWDDKHGKTGISFQCDNSSAQTRYHEWLHDHLFMMQTDVSPLYESEQEQEPYVAQPFIRKIFNVPDLAYLHNGRDRLRRAGTVRDTEESGSLLGASPQQQDRGAHRSGSGDPRTFN